MILPGRAVPHRPRARRASTGSTVLIAALAIANAGACTDRQPAPSPSPPSQGPGETTRNTRRLPDRYVIVGPRGALAFAGVPGHAPVAALAAQVAPPRRLGAGFGFVVVDERTVAGRRYLRIADGRWLTATDVLPVAPSTFVGVQISSAAAPTVAWVVAAEATIRTAPHAAADVVTTRPAHSRVRLRGPCRLTWCPLDTGWMRAADVAIAAYRARPAGVGPSERWIDIDLQSQVLVAYEGERPLYATLVSTGIGAPGSAFATPTGLFTLVSKRTLVRMDNLEHTNVVPYAYDVPLAQYFTDGKAIHAALWHDHFGHPTSHGCVNVAPADAEWLFAFTSPAVPRGAPRADANAGHRGTVIVVHGTLPRPSAGLSGNVLADDERSQ